LEAERLTGLSSKKFYQNPTTKPLDSELTFLSNAGIMVGTGAEPATGISKSTVKEWREQVRD
jgi:hypothetical protein